MAAKNKGLGGLVYSTNPDFQPEQNDFEQHETLPPARQKLRVVKDNKQRGGKIVTLVEGFHGKTEDLEELCRKLKTKCGTGGSAKEGYILIQGDYKEKIVTWLKEWGYTATR